MWSPTSNTCVVACGIVLIVVFDQYHNSYYNNNFFCANNLEDQAQWRDKNQGIKQCASHQWTNEDSRKLRRIRRIK